MTDNSELFRALLWLMLAMTVSFAIATLWLAAEERRIDRRDMEDQRRESTERDQADPPLT
jgi:hypothetical protein